LEERSVDGLLLIVIMLCFCDLLGPLVLITRLYTVGPPVSISTGSTYQFPLVLSVFLDRVHVVVYLSAACCCALARTRIYARIYHLLHEPKSQWQASTGDLNGGSRNSVNLLSYV
jgi:hypothetical protein